MEDILVNFTNSAHGGRTKRARNQRENRVQLIGLPIAKLRRQHKKLESVRGLSGQIRYLRPEMPAAVLEGGGGGVGGAVEQLLWGAAEGANVLRTFP